MKRRNVAVEFMMVFFIVTACVTILEGLMGMIFFPEVKMGYEAFFSPPVFGFLSALSGIVTYSSKELSVKQALVRKAIHLSLIEVMIFGVNAIAGNIFETKVCIALVISIAIVYVIVDVVLWINDCKYAEKFNQRLKIFQENQQKM